MIKNNIVIENAQLVFRNFSGKEGQFNTKGNRNFCVLIDDEAAQEMETDGWNIRRLKPKDENEKPQPYLPVAVSYGNIPPKIVLVTQKGKTQLDEESVNVLDWAEISSVDLIIRPYNWEVRGAKGVKGYVKSMYVTIQEDEFESKYYDVPDSATNAIGGCGSCETCDGNCKHHDD